ACGMLRYGTNNFSLLDALPISVLQGYVDVVQPDGSVIDWKTNRVPYGATETKQLALYCWAINQLKSASYSNSVQGTYFFLRFRKIGRAHVLTPVTFRSRMPSSA